MKLLRKLAVCSFIWLTIIVIWCSLQKLDVYPNLFVEGDNIFRAIMGLISIVILGLTVYAVYKENKEFE